MESVLLQEQRVLQKLVTAYQALQNIPPDIREERGLDQTLEELEDAVDMQQSRVDLRARHLEISKSKTKAVLDSETLTKKEGMNDYQNFVVAIRRLFEVGDPSTSNVVDMLNTAAGKDFVQQYGIHLVYDPEDETLSLYNGQGKQLFSLQGEDMREELRSSLVHPWYGQLGQEELEPPDILPRPTIAEQEEFAELQRIKSKPKKDLIGKLFAAFNDCLDVDDRVSYSFRTNTDTDSIYLLYKGEDIAGYKLSNVAWPHLESAKDSRGNTIFRERGDWAKLSPFERGTLRRKFEIQTANQGRLFFNPLQGVDAILGHGRTKKFDSRRLAGWK